MLEHPRIATRVVLISFGPRDSTAWLARALAPHAWVSLFVPDAMLGTDNAPDLVARRTLEVYELARARAYT